MLTKEQAINLLHEKQSYLAAELGVSRIGIFGSFANGLPAESSDVDIIVEFEHPIGLRFVELVDYLENLMGRDVDVLTPAGIQNIRLEQIARSLTQSIVYV